jgi:hypothetical protein
MYIGGPQWRHIDLNGAFFAQSGGGKATFFFHWNEICLKPLGFPARRCPHDGIPAPPLAKQLCNRDCYSGDPRGQTKNQHHVSEEKRHASRLA